MTEIWNASNSKHAVPFDMTNMLKGKSETRIGGSPSYGLYTTGDLQERARWHSVVL